MRPARDPERTLQGQGPAVDPSPDSHDGHRTSPAISFINGGKLRALAVTSKERAPPPTSPRSARPSRVRELRLVRNRRPDGHAEGDRRQGVPRRRQVARLDRDARAFFVQGFETVGTRPRVRAMRTERAVAEGRARAQDQANAEGEPMLRVEPSAIEEAAKTLWLPGAEAAAAGREGGWRARRRRDRRARRASSV